MSDRVEVDLQHYRDLPHGGHLLAGPQYSGAEGLEHLVADLHVTGTELRCRTLTYDLRTALWRREDETRSSVPAGG